jgi:hypothetical protein
MKKYFFSILALALAVASVAFSTKGTTDVFFEYAGPDFTATEVEKPENWTEVADFGSCNNVPALPCRIKVDLSDTDQGTPGQRLLLSGTDINTSLSGSGAYVLDASGDVLESKNRN